MSTATEGFNAPQPEMVVWVVYDHDRGPYAIAVFASAEEACRYTAESGYGRIARWVVGTEFRDSIAEWEAKS